METIEGIVAKITYCNETTGFTVAKLEQAGQSHLTTIIGVMPLLQVGTELRLQGEWETHPLYGNQFRVTSYIPLTPGTLAGIEKFLGSGAIQGVGPATAARMVAHFGEEILTILADAPHRLAEVPGIGPAKAERIGRSFAAQRDITDVMVFLGTYGITPGLAARIYRRYGVATIPIVRENPYRLANEVEGIGFRTADKVAAQLGIAPDAPARLAAGLLFVLSEAAGAGHLYLPEDVLARMAGELLHVSPAALDAPLELIVHSRQVHREVQGEDRLYYLPPFYYAERGAARQLLGLRATVEPFPGGDPGELIAAWEEATGITLVAEQRRAVITALSGGVVVITGGPGTGKTMITRCIIDLLEQEGYGVALAAPTGRAAKRLSEATGGEAKTIHRLLEYIHDETGGLGFQRDERRPLAADAVIVDEVSMVDMLLMYQLLKAIRPGTRIVLVGDVDQLPSVGPGNVLKEIIAAGVVPVVRLTEIFRQAQTSMIVVNAHRINHGEMPLLNQPDGDFFFLPCEDPAAIPETIVDLCARRLPKTYGYSPLEDIQVLAPMHRTLAGVEQLNRELQQALNPPSPDKTELEAGERLFRVGDRVMQMKNNYDKGVYNGDIGRIYYIDGEEGEVHVIFPDGETVVYFRGELDELALAYAISVHKSQGSEYPVVVMPVTRQHRVMLQRNLLYTAVTRARQLVVLVGDREALGLAVANTQTQHRYTRLAEQLRELAELSLTEEGRR